eukprot:TRINITY_DN1442_c0_g1_i10.p1 TRINITY_DN1442_c0_g1~~TRINITY_DN1442_c0_g1_i10.p1  ORF type:complete len:288 (-),score=70.71 TRINITY_DN1442_c0_g1_i10:598-1461(-)
MSRPSSTDGGNSRFDISAKEAELRRRNEELDSLKQQVVKKAESAIRDQGGKLAKETRELVQSCLNTRSSAESTSGRNLTRTGDSGVFSPPLSPRNRSGEPPLEPPIIAARPTVSERQTQAASPAPSPALESQPQPIEGASLEAQVRFLKAKLKVVQSDFDNAKMENERKDAEIMSLRQKVKESNESYASLQKACSGLEAQLEKATKQSEEMRDKLLSTDQQLQSIKKDYDASVKVQKQSETDNAARNARLNRALEEVEKYKKLYKEASEQGKDASGISKQQYDKLLA